MSFAPSARVGETAGFCADASCGLNVGEKGRGNSIRPGLCACVCARVPPLLTFSGCFGNLICHGDGTALGRAAHSKIVATTTTAAATATSVTMFPRQPKEKKKGRRNLPSSFIASIVSCRFVILEPMIRRKRYVIWQPCALTTPFNL